ncbi:hypothetical protein C8R43DRAFT_943164 [Mycena crocata]|nr:hypothetical protein C8R43DRAFT_943164 [Mycena crocata]
MKLVITAILAISITLLLPGGVFAGGLSSAQVVTNIKVVTVVSGNIDKGLQGLTPSNAFNPLTVIKIGETVVTGFTKIVSSLTADVTAMQATAPITLDSLCTPIVDALILFVKVHQLLLSTVIGKHGIFAQCGFVAPILVVLRLIEGIVDTFAFALIGLIPSKSGEVKNGAAMLSGTVKETITVYSQICLPGPFYPPVCVGGKPATTVTSTKSPVVKIPVTKVNNVPSTTIVHVVEDPSDDMPDDDESGDDPEDDSDASDSD